MEGKIINLDLARLTHIFASATIDANRLSYQIPQCKMVQDFLRLHNLPWQAFYIPLALIVATTPAERTDFLAHMRSLYLCTEKKRVALRVEYGVGSEDELPHERRVFFDAALRTYIESEDHYP